LVAIERLRAVAARLGELDDGGGEAGLWFARVLGTYEASQPYQRFDEVAGLISEHGEPSWRQIERRDRRDRLIAALARDFFAAEQRLGDFLCPTSVRQLRYEASAWRRDRQLKRPPEHYRGRPKERLFLILKCGEAPGERTIRRVLRGAGSGPSGRFPLAQRVCDPFQPIEGALDAAAETQTATDCRPGGIGDPAGR